MIVSGNGPASSRHGQGPEVRFQKYEGEIGHEILKGSQPEGFPSMNDQEKCQDLAVKILSSIKEVVAGAAEDISKTLEDFDETDKWCGTFKRDEAFREGMLDGLMLFQKLAKKAGVKVSILQRMYRAVDNVATKLIGKWNRDEFFSESLKSERRTTNRTIIEHWAKQSAKKTIVEGFTPKTEWTKDMSGTAGELSAGLRDDTPTLPAVFEVSPVLDGETEVSDWVFFDNEGDEYTLPTTTVDLADLYDQYNVSIECGVKKVEVKNNKVLLVLDDPACSDGKNDSKPAGMTVEEILAEVSKADPDSEIEAALASDPAKSVKVFIEFENDASYGLYPDGYGKKKKDLKLLGMPEGLADEIMDLHGEEIMDKYVDEYKEDSRREADYDRMSDYVYRNGRYVLDPSLA